MSAADCLSRFQDAVIYELRAMQDAELISIRTYARAVRAIQDNPDMFTADYRVEHGRRDAPISVSAAADMAISLADCYR